MQFLSYAMLFIFYLLQNVFCDRPRINEEGKVLADDDSIQKAQGDVLKLTCTADFPVKWVLPNNEQYENFNNSERDGRLETINNVTIILTDLRWTDTGFYSCMAKDSEYRKPLSTMKDDENRIYIFVKDHSDPAHLFLHLKDEHVNFTRSETSYINCLVTDKSATVEIISHETNVVDKLNYDKLNYDPRFGFEIKPGSLADINIDHVDCSAQTDEDIYQSPVFLPIILAALKDHVILDDDFVVSISLDEVEDVFYLTNNVTMSCDANSQHKNCKLETPKGQTISRNSSVELTINNVDYSHSGTYKCTCQDIMHPYPNRTKTVQKEIMVRDHDSAHLFLHLKEEHVFFDRDRDFVVSISLDEDKDVFYLTNNVTMSCDTTYQYKNCKLETPKGQTISKNNSVELIINNVDYPHSGTYKCTCQDIRYPSAKWTPTRTVQKEITVRGNIQSKYLKATAYVDPCYMFHKKKGKIILVDGNIGRLIIKEQKRKRFDVTVRMPHDFLSKVVVRWFHRYSILMKDEVIIEEIINYNYRNIKKVNVKFTPTKKDGNDEISTFDETPEIQTGLIILNAHTNLSGDYILSLQALDEVVNYTFTLEVISSSILNKLLVTEENSNVQLNSNYLELGKSYDVWCTAEGLPKQNLSLSCLPYITGDRCIYKTFEKIATFQNALVARVTASQSGTYNCGKNKSVPFIVTDIPDAQRNQGFNVEVNIMPKLPNVFQHMDVTVTCKMQKYDTYQSPKWYYQSPSGGRIVQLSKVIDGYYTIHNLTDEFSNKSVLTINNIQKEHAGTYICQSYKSTNSTIVKSNATITVLETIHPWFGNNSSSIEEDFTYSDRAIIVCDAHGEPFPNVQWLKDGSDISKATKPGINFDKNNTILVISRVISEDSGTYTCIVSNFAGYQVSKLFRRNVIGAFPSYLIAISCIFAVIVIILIGIICFWFYKRNRSGRAECTQRQPANGWNEIVMTNARKRLTN